MDSPTPPPLPLLLPLPETPIEAPPVTGYPGFWRAVGLLLFLFAVQVVLMSAAALWSLFTGGTRDIPVPALALGLVNLVSFGVVSGWIGRRSRWPLASLLGVLPPAGTFAPRNVLALVTAVAGQLMFSIGLIYAIGGKEIANSDYVKRLEDVMGGGQAWWTVVPVLVIVAPLTEEILFRGQFLRGFLDRYPAGVAIGLSAALFSVMHMNPVQAPATFLLGILAGWLYYRTRSVWPAIAAHFVNNAFPALALASGASQQAKANAAAEPAFAAAVGMAVGGLTVWGAALQALRQWVPAAAVPEAVRFDKIEGMSSSPAASASRDQLRSQAGVQLVKAENEGFALAKQPGGTYGFTGSPLAECPVFAKQTYQSWEVQKRADNGQWIVGYVSTEQEALIASDQEPIEVTIYPEPHEKATQLVTVRLERIIKKKQPSRIDGNYIQMTLARF